MHWISIFYTLFYNGFIMRFSETAKTTFFIFPIIPSFFLLRNQTSVLRIDHLTYSITNLIFPELPMNSSPKIFVFKMRSLIYTLLLLFFTISLIICLLLMFSPGSRKDGQVQTAAEHTSNSSISSRYIPGVYTSPVPLGDSSLNVEVTLDADRIRSIRLTNLSETTAVAFPLVSSSFEHISDQIIAKQSLSDITAPSENRYTSQLLLNVISELLSRAMA